MNGGLNFEPDGLSVGQVEEQCPNFVRLLRAIASERYRRLNPEYKFQRKGMGDELQAGEIWAAAVNWDDDEEVENIVTVDCDTYDEYLKREGGVIGDQLISDLEDGQDRTDTYGQNAFLYGRDE